MRVDYGLFPESNVIVRILQTRHGVGEAEGRAPSEDHTTPPRASSRTAIYS